MKKSQLVKIIKEEILKEYNYDYKKANEIVITNLLQTETILGDIKLQNYGKMDKKDQTRLFQMQKELLGLVNDYKKIVARMNKY